MTATAAPITSDHLDVGTAFSRAWTHTRHVLFRPSRATWLEYGVVFFLAGLVDPMLGGFFRLQWPRARAFMPRVIDSDTLAIGGAIALLALAIVIALAWIGCRGAIIAFDSVAHSRVDLHQGWRDAKQPASALFRSYVALWLVAWIAIVPIVTLGALRAGAMYEAGRDDDDVMRQLIPHVVMLAGIFAALWLVLFFVRTFVTPVLLHVRCGAREAWTRAWTIASADVLGVALLLFARVAIGAVSAFASLIVMFSTCFLGALPVIHQTLLAPIYFFDRSLTLHTIATLGGEYSDIVEGA